MCLCVYVCLTACVNSAKLDGRAIYSVDATGHRVIRNSVLWASRIRCLIDSGGWKSHPQSLVEENKGRKPWARPAEDRKRSKSW